MSILEGILAWLKLMRERERVTGVLLSYIMDNIACLFWIML